MPQQEEYNWFGEQSQDNNAGGNGHGNGWGNQGGGPGNHNGGGYGTTEPPNEPPDTVPIGDIVIPLIFTALIILIKFRKKIVL